MGFEIRTTSNKQHILQTYPHFAKSSSYYIMNKLDQSTAIKEGRALGQMQPYVVTYFRIFSKHTPLSVTNLQHTQCTIKKVINLWSSNLKLPLNSKKKPLR